MGTDLKKIVGQRLQRLRLEKNLTQEQMGEKLNLSTSAYCKIEYGETDLTLTRLSKIAEILNMPATDLFCKIVEDTSSDNDNLRELINANSKMIDLLYKRINTLEERFR